MRLLRLGFRALQAVSPTRAAVLAERLLFTPPRSHLSAPMRAELERGRPFTLTVDGRRVACWSWGGPDAPVVYLAHGWGSRGGRLAAYVRPLQSAGYRVITYDGVGHGASEGQRSSAPELARTLVALAELAGPPQAVVAHSLGAAAATLAMEWGVPVSRAAFIAPNADPVRFAMGWTRQLGLRPEVVARLRAASERRIRFSWDDLDIVAMARRRAIPLLVIHDAEDDVVAWTEGEAMAAAWPGARMVTTRGLGHSQVVRSPDVVAQVVEFLGRPERAPRPSLPPPRGSREFEHELFYRERRPPPALSA